MAKKCYNSVVIRALMALFLCVLLVSANQLQSFSTGEPPAGPGGSSGKTISGTVLAEDTNLPLNDHVNAYVYLEEDDHSRTTVLSQSVESDGRFTVSDIVYQDFILSFDPEMASDYLPKDFHVTVSGDTIEIDGQEYQQDNFTVTLNKTKVKGTVTKPDGTPLYDLSVKVYTDNNFNNQFNITGSNSGGGLYKLMTEGYGKLSYYVYDDTSELYGFSAITDVTINEDGSYSVNETPYSIGETQTLDLQLPALQFKGKIYDSDGTTIQSNSYIVIRDAEENVVRKYQLFNRNALNGVFLIGGLPDGTYSLYAESADQIRSSESKEIEIDGANIMVDNMSYSGDYINLSLPECNDPTLVKGSLLDSTTNQPILGENIQLFVPNGCNATTNANGEFMITGLTDDEHRILVWPDSSSDYLLKEVVLIVSGDTVNIDGQEYSRDNAAICLNKTKVKGTVTKPDGTPLYDLSVKVYTDNNFNNHFNITGSNSGGGLYKLMTEGYGKLSYYVYDNSSELYGFSAITDVTINEDGSYSVNETPYSFGETQTLNLHLPALQFKGKIYDSDGTTIQTEAYVTVKNALGEIVRKYKMIENDPHRGIFMIGGLPDGTYSLQAESTDQGMYSASKEVTISGLNITVDGVSYSSDNYIGLSLTEFNDTISGFFLDDETNQPIYEDGFFIGVPYGCESEINTNGEFIITGLTNGEHEMFIWTDPSSDYLGKHVLLFVSGDSVTIDGQEYNRNNVVVRLGKTKVKGTVTNPDGNIASNVFIHAYSPDRSILYSSAAVNGKYKINSDVAGSLSYYAYDRSSESYGFSDRIDMTVNDDGSYQINGNPHPKGEVLAVNLELPVLQFKGKVFDSSGTEVQTGHFVIVRNALGEIVRKYRLFELEFNHQGVFLIGGLPDGVYSLYAATEGWAVEWLSPSVEIRINGSSITADGVAYSSDQYINLLLSIPDAFCGITIDRISGKVQGNTVEVKGTSTIEDLDVKVLGPDGSVYHEGSLTSVNGEYSYTFALASDAAIGEYKVFVGLGVNKALRTFSVSRYTPPSDDSSGGGGGNATVPPTPTPTVTPTPTTAPVPTPVPMQTLTPEEQKQAGEEISKQLEEGTKNLVGNSAEETKGNLQNIAGSITSAIASTGQSTSQETQETIKKAVEDSINSIVNAVQTLADDDDLHSAGASLNQIISDTAGLISDDLDSAGAQAVTESIGSVINGVRSVLGQMNDLNKAADLAKSIISSAGDVLGKVDGGAAEDKVAEQLKGIAKAVVDKAGKQTVEAVKTGDTALATVQGDQLNDVIKQLETVKAVAEELQESLKRSGIDEEIETKIAIDIQIGAEEKNVRAELPKELMEAVDKNGINKVEITAGDTKIDLHTDFVENAGTQSLALEVRKEEANDELKSKMTEEQKKLLENNPTIFNFNAIVGGAQVTEFNKPVGIRIKYELKENENPDNITILYLADDGTIQNMTGKYDEATGEVVFSTNHFSKYIIKNLVLSFTDVPDDFWGIGCIRSMASKGIIEGIGNGQFLPYDNVTRAEFAKMLTVAAGLVDKNATCEFTDVPKDKWYYKYIASAYASGLTGGIYYTEFGPDVKMTRQEMAAMIANAMQADITSEEALEIVGEYNDYELLSDHLVKGMAIAVKTGIINGKPGKLLDPEGHATRAEAAAMIYRYFNY